MTHTSTEQERAEFTDGAWYWVEKEGWIGDQPTIAPAKYKANCDAWYSFEFSGVPTREVKVLEPCTRSQPVARTPLSDSEVDDLWEGATGGHSFTEETRRTFVRAIEAAHGITQEKQG